MLLLADDMLLLADGRLLLADGRLLQITEQMPKFAERPFLDDRNFRNVQLKLKGEFTWTLCFRPSFVAALSYEGFLSICSDQGGSAQPGLYVLLPKMHVQRCVVYPLTRDSLKCSKSTRR